MSVPPEIMAMMGGGQPQMGQEPMAGMLPTEMTTNPMPEMPVAPGVQPDGLGMIDEDLPRGEVIDWTLRG